MEYRTNRSKIVIALFTVVIFIGLCSASLRLSANVIAKWDDNPLYAAMLAPHDWQIQWALSLNQILNHECAGATVTLKLILKTAPHFWSAKNNLAICYATMGKWEDAEKELKEIIQQWPYHPEAIKNLSELSKRPR